MGRQRWQDEQEDWLNRSNQPAPTSTSVPAGLRSGPPLQQWTEPYNPEYGLHIGSGRPEYPPLNQNEPLYKGGAEGLPGKPMRGLDLLYRQRQGMQSQLAPSPITPSWQRGGIYITDPQAERFEQARERAGIPPDKEEADYTPMERARLGFWLRLLHLEHGAPGLPQRKETYEV